MSKKEEFIPIPETFEDYSPNDERMLQSRYGDRERLGEELSQARELLKKNSLLADGSPNPNRIRFEMQEAIARMNFDMGFLLARNRLQAEQIEMLNTMYQRMGILEGAYSHLMAMTQGVKLEYYAKLKKFVDKKPDA
jgi:hypothetical protein